MAQAQWVNVAVQVALLWRTDAPPIYYLLPFLIIWSESMNSSIEAAVDFAGTQRSPVAKKAKDIAALGVRLLQRLPQPLLSRFLPHGASLRRVPGPARRSPPPTPLPALA